MKANRVLIFDSDARRAKDRNDYEREIDGHKKRIAEIREQRQALAVELSGRLSALRKLSDKTDSAINKIAVRGKVRVRIRQSLYDGGNYYGAVIVKRDGSESSARNRWKTICLDKWSGWKILE